MKKDFKNYLLLASNNIRLRVPILLLATTLKKWIELTY